MDIHIQALIDKLREGDTAVLSRCITVLESGRAADKEIGKKLLTACFSFAGKSLRIGITGIPGVGKSTFIEALGTFLTKEGKKVAVLAVDPSSSIAKGSILGDKTRMRELASDQRAFIRPSPARGSLGGVANGTRGSIILCETAGFDVILIETVGTGQSEYEVRSMVDFFMLLTQAGTGDYIQAIKKGVMEMADAIVINKADLDNEQAVRQTQREMEQALSIAAVQRRGWKPKTALCSSLRKSGMETVWRIIKDHHTLSKETGFFYKNRDAQKIQWLKHLINEQLKEDFYNDVQIQKRFAEIGRDVETGKLNPFEAASRLMRLYYK